MLYTLAVILALAWALAFGVFNVPGGMIHLLLLLSATSMLGHFIQRRRGRLTPSPARSR